jgi:hypothetical protein
MSVAVKDYIITLQDKSGNEAQPNTINSYDLACRFGIKSKTYSWTIYITKWPTGNCQLTSVAYMNFMLDKTQSNKEDVHAILRECYRLCNGNPAAPFTPKLIMIDVKKEYIERVESCFEVVMKNPYVSTNGSNMCLFMVKVDYNLQ